MVIIHRIFPLKSIYVFLMHAFCPYAADFGI
jgi:hypothetical protein